MCRYPTGDMSQRPKTAEQILAIKQQQKKPQTLGLKRIPSICCPEPSCDYTWHDNHECKSCGKLCQECDRRRGNADYMGFITDTIK